MAGHSHWKNIKRKKAVVDARRGGVVEGGAADHDCGEAGGESE
ncbi:MAG TPA: hypothetical protein VHM90_08120 [Phycisphaerae bacterium]|jgi:transcriptional/translational regulatory protein YebC/TACO1|nr:hypothetical protein [Phycisphaerae bacterium]